MLPTHTTTLGTGSGHVTIRESTPSTTHITPPSTSALPDELILSIFSLLNPLDVVKARSVCKQWNAVALDEQLWKYFLLCDPVHLTYHLPETGSFEIFKAAALCNRILHSNSEYDIYPSQIFQAHPTSVYSLKYAKGMLFSTSFTGKEKALKVWNLETDKAPIKVVPGHFCSLECSDDGKLLYAGTQNEVMIWDMTTDSNLPMKTIKVDGAFEITGLHHKDEKLYLGTIYGVIKIVDLGKDDNSLPITYEGHVESLADHAFAIVKGVLPVGERLISCGGGTIKIWNLAGENSPAENSCLIKTLEWESRIPDDANSIAYGNGMIYSCHEDGIIRTWDLDGNLIKEMSGHTGPVMAVVFNEGMLFSGAKDGTVKIWDIKKNVCIRTLDKLPKNISSLDCNDGMLVAGYEDGKIRTWNLNHLNTRKKNPPSQPGICRLS